jgi:hypothetical protein
LATFPEVCHLGLDVGEVRAEDRHGGPTQNVEPEETPLARAGVDYGQIADNYQRPFGYVIDRVLARLDGAQAPEELGVGSAQDLRRPIRRRWLAISSAASIAV